MSEYQYYEWQTIDQRLSADEQAKVEGLSSHMDIVTSTQAVVTYSWGDFKHDPKKVLLTYFDAFLYDSNFGSRCLMFRLPKNQVEVASLQAYLVEDQIMLEPHGRYDVLEIRINGDADLFEWVESDNVLDQLTPLREQLLQGDTSMLYLAWLKAISLEDPEAAKEEPEPPVPTGLKKLSVSLHTFAQFFQINSHLIAAAAVSSKRVRPAPDPDFESAIGKLSRAECEFHLKQILSAEPGAVASLKKRLAQLRGGRPTAQASPARTVGQLFEQARRLEVDAKRKARETAEREKIRRLEKLSRAEESTWTYVENLLGQKRGSAYEEATKLVVELRDMAEYKRRRKDFSERFEFICKRYGRSVALMDRFRRAGLL